MNEADFIRIGKEQVLNENINKIKGKSDYLKQKNTAVQDKLATLKDIEKLARDSHKLLTDLTAKK